MYSYIKSSETFIRTGRKQKQLSRKTAGKKEGINRSENVSSKKLDEKGNQNFNIVIVFLLVYIFGRTK